MYLTKAADGKNNIVGKNLYYFRKQRNLSQVALAELLQISGFDADRHVIRRIENGRRYVTDIEIAIISATLKIPVQELLK